MACWWRKPWGYAEGCLATDVIFEIKLYLREDDLATPSHRTADAAMERTRATAGRVLCLVEQAASSITRRSDCRRHSNLAVEVLSASNTKAEMERKLKEYFWPALLVWIVDPFKRTVAVHSAPMRSQTLHEDDVLDGSRVTGFYPPVAEAIWPAFPRISAVPRRSERPSEIARRRSYGNRSLVETSSMSDTPHSIAIFSVVAPGDVPRPTRASW